MLMKGNMNHEIYFLKYSTFMKKVVVSRSLDQHDAKTELWHPRLGYMSEKGMSVLRK